MIAKKESLDKEHWPHHRPFTMKWIREHAATEMALAECSELRQLY